MRFPIQMAERAWWMAVKSTRKDNGAKPMEVERIGVMVNGRVTGPLTLTQPAHHQSCSDSPSWSSLRLMPLIGVLMSPPQQKILCQGASKCLRLAKKLCKKNKRSR